MCSRFWQNVRRGFTLPEMLVVVAVAGILATIAFSSYTEAKAQSRDRLRMAQLEQMKVALELYKDKYGRYPEVGCRPSVNYANTAINPLWAGPGGQGGWGFDCDEYIVGHAVGINFVPDFITELPRDPSRENENSIGYIYAVSAGGTNYKLLSHRAAESLLVNSYDHPFSRCAGACNPPNNIVCGDLAAGGAIQNNTYAIFSAGATCW